jgi:hypothetical protein
MLAIPTDHFVAGALTAYVYEYININRELLSRANKIEIRDERTDFERRSFLYISGGIDSLPRGQASGRAFGDCSAPSIKLSSLFRYSVARR